jgi:transcriptional regulator with XRE-family HTH domain
MAQLRTYSPVATEALRLLGERIRVARRRRRWTVEDLAERIGASHGTVTKLERGDPGVRIGTVFEAAVLLGVPLFHADPVRREVERRQLATELALLPKRARKPVIDDDF